MVKKRVGGAHRYKAVQRATAAAAVAGRGAGDGAATAAAPARSTKQQQPAEDGPKPPSHLQRKITKQVKFYDRVLAQGAVKAGGVQKRTPKKKASAAATLASLDSLAAELDAAAAAAAGGSSAACASAKQRLLAKGTKSSIKRSKARLAVGVAEGQRLARVLAHPAYRADPIAAITNHLATTMPAVAVVAGAAGGKQQQQQQQRKKKRQGGGGAGSGGGAAMQS